MTKRKSRLQSSRKAQTKQKNKGREGHSKYIISIKKVNKFNSVTQSCPTLCDPWTVACQASLSFIISRGLLNLMSTESMKPSSHFILCLSLLLLPSIFPSIRIFSNESALHIRWPKYSSFSFSISLSNEYSGLISFRIDWFDLQGTLKSLLQHHSSKASILWCSTFLMVSHIKR